VSRLFAPATQRNRDPILAVLRQVLPPCGLVLEIASGTGEHVAHFAGTLPDLTWQPSDPSPEHRQSIAAWAVELGVTSIRPPLDLDVRHLPWPVARADAILAINLIHIAPWEATLALLRGSAALLAPGSPLYLYGPYRRRDLPTAPSNETFDQSLRERDPSWGLRELEVVLDEAEREGLVLDQVVEMPANNLSVVIRRA
jgi:SAM-dependent methyltransferase